MVVLVAILSAVYLASRADAGAPFMWHRAWALQQEASRTKQFNGAVYDALVACQEMYCNHAIENKCNLDCVVPEHGCLDYCYRNKRKYMISTHAQAKYYICANGKIRGKVRDRQCKANGFPSDSDPKDSTSTTCCSYFGCDGGPVGQCSPSTVRIQCQNEVETQGNPKLVGCIKQISNKLGRNLPQSDNLDQLRSYSGGDMSVEVPWQAFRRRKFKHVYKSATEGPVIGPDGSGPLPVNSSRLEEIDPDQLVSEAGAGGKFSPRITALLATLGGAATGLGVAGFIQRRMCLRISDQHGAGQDDTDADDAALLD